MFSEEDISLFRIEVNLPDKEGKANLIEQFMTKYPLNTLKFAAMQDMMIKLREVLDKIPTIVLQSPGVSLSISKKKMLLEVKEAHTIEASSDEKKPKVAKPFSETSLKRISDDFNFITAGILGILSVESLATKGILRSSKDIDHDLRFDAFFVPDFWNKIGEFEERHVSGLQVEFDKPLIGIGAHHKIRVSSTTKDDKKKEVNIDNLFHFELKGPIDLGSMFKDGIETINMVYGRLTGVT